MRVLTGWKKVYSVLERIRQLRSLHATAFGGA